ncbi:MAG: radical SAM protein [Planctomycetota bacterium]|jgi:radical SAM superfamily enzyme YgiQ (UPF0313 family)
MSTPSTGSNNNAKPGSGIPENSARTVKKFFEENGPDLTGGGLWAHGSEIGTVNPAEWESSPLRVLVARLSTYRDVSQSISHGLVAQLFRTAGAYVDFAYLPPPRDIEFLRSERVPLLFGTTSKHPATDFDIVAFSCSYILETVNIPILLSGSGIPYARSERLDRDDIPLIILGGASAQTTHIANGRADGMDALIDMRFPGDGEATVPLIAEIAAKHRGDKREMISEMRDRIPGAHEPGTKNKPGSMPANAFDFDSTPGCTEPLIQFEESEWHGTKIEIARGCAHGCSFCEEGFEYRPCRERSPGNIAEAVLAAKRFAAVEAMDLASFNFTDHGDLAGILRSILPLVRRITLKSGRLDAIARNPAIASALAALGKRDATGGVEGISERLRRFCNKHVTSDEVVAACRSFLEAGMREIKLFFVFTGLENDEDLEEYNTLLSRVVEARDKIRRRTTIVCSFTPLMIMPNTPLQWMSCRPLDIRRDKRISRIKSLTRNCRCTFRLATTEEEYRLGQFLALAEGKHLEEMVKSILASGEPYYGKVSKKLHSALGKFLADGRELDKIMKAGKKPDHAFPWDNSPTGIAKDFLYKNYEQAVAFENSEPCLLAEPDSGKCLDCGACPEPSVPAEVRPFSLSPSDIERLGNRYGERETVRVAIRIAPEFRKIPKEYIGIAAAAALLGNDESARAYHGAADALWRHLPISRNGDPAAGLHIHEFEFIKPFSMKSLPAGIPQARFKYGTIEGVIVPTIKLKVDRLRYKVNLPSESDAKRFENTIRQVLEKKKVGFSLPEENGARRLLLKKKPLKSKFAAALIDAGSLSAQFVVKREFGFTDFVFTALGRAAHKTIWSLEKVYFIPEDGEECSDCGKILEYDSFSEKPAADKCLSCSAPF